MPMCAGKEKAQKKKKNETTCKVDGKVLIMESVAYK